MRLRARIAVVIVVFAVAGFCGMTAAGWLLVLRAEDEILEALVLESVRELDWSPAKAVPGWIEGFDDAVALRRATGLASVPEVEGWHELFANEARTEAVAVERMRDRWRVWRSGELEREYRLQVRSEAPRWVLVNFSKFEFTEARADGILRLILIIAAAVAFVALVLSALIARWTLRPVIALAQRVRTQPAGALGLGLSDDEIGFLARSLDEARAREDAALQRERQFIAECSHELRTPLATLKSALALLPETEGDAGARQRVLARMDRAMARTERLVQFFLVLAREGREPADVGPVPLGPVIREVVEEQRAVCSGIAPEVEIEVDDRACVRASRDVVTVLLHNIVANAFHHASGGRLHVSWVQGCVVRVDDDGPGFPDFRDGGRAVGAVPNTGFGVGLLLSERLCRTQGWTMERGVSELGGARVDIVFGGACKQPAGRDE